MCRQPALRGKNARVSSLLLPSVVLSFQLLSSGRKQYRITPQERELSGIQDLLLEQDGDLHACQLRLGELESTLLRSCALGSTPSDSYSGGLVMRIGSRSAEE